MNKLIIVVTTFLFSSSIFGWTINNSARRGFAVNEITIDIGSNDCQNAGYTASQLKDLIQEVVDDYWNTVSSSALELTVGSISSTDVSSVSSLDNLVDQTTKNHILIGCNSSISDFSNTSILGQGGISCDTTACYGVVAINDVSGTKVASQSKTALNAVIAHELGHALGLGHTSVEHALMYYNISGKEQEYLAQDDIDGISYLYPHESKAAGLLGACGSLAFVDDKQDPPSSGRGPLLFSLLAFLLAIFTVSMKPKSLPITIEST